MNPLIRNVSKADFMKFIEAHMNGVKVNEAQPSFFAEQITFAAEQWERMMVAEGRAEGKEEAY